MTYELENLSTISHQEFYLDSEYNDYDYKYDFVKDFPEYVCLKINYDSKYYY